MASSILLQFRHAPLQCSEFYSTQPFSWCGWFIVFCRAFFFLPSLPGTVSLLLFGIGIRVGGWVRVRVGSVLFTYLLSF